MNGMHRVTEEPSVGSANQPGAALNDGPSHRSVPGGTWTRSKPQSWRTIPSPVGIHPASPASTKNRRGPAAEARDANVDRYLVAVGDEPEVLDLPEIWGHGSFPASDPPANW